MTDYKTASSVTLNHAEQRIVQELALEVKTMRPAPVNKQHMFRHFIAVELDIEMSDAEVFTLT